MTRGREVDSLYGRGIEELECTIGLSVEQAKEFLLRSVEDSVKHDKTRLIHDPENNAKEEADREVKGCVVNTIQHYTTGGVAESTVSMVQLPNDETKGHIIGREGRNTRTLEQLTGVELIVDDTLEAVALSGFDPVCRETTKAVLEKLTNDGRVHPTWTEEMVEKARREIDIRMREAGEAVVLEVDVHSVHSELVKLLGRMRYRTNYGQNALRHSIEAAGLSGILAAKVSVDVRMAKHAGLLRDIGRAIDYEIEGSHIQLSAELCRKYRENQIIINMVESHHDDVGPESLTVCTVQAADTISMTRPGVRRGTTKTHTNRLVQLEEITNSSEGVEKSLAVQAGREVHTMAIPEKVTDDDMVILAHNVVKRIGQEMQYPGQVRINVIREPRIQDVAR